MGLLRCTDDTTDPRGIAYEHEGYNVTLTGDWRQWFTQTATGPVAEPTEVDGSWWRTTAGVDMKGDLPCRAITGWRMGCSCGWRAERIHVREDNPGGDCHSEDGWPPHFVEGYGEAAWGAHLDQVLAAAYSPVAAAHR